MNEPNLNPTSMDGANTPATEPPKERLRSLMENANIADSLDEDKLVEIGQIVKQGYDDDRASRREWEEKMEEWTKLAIQYKQPKTFPWHGAANIKYPLLSTAAMQFAARAYPALVPANGQVVSAKVIGKDPTGQKGAQATRVSTYMSYQIMHEMRGWEEDMDKMLNMLPIVGCLFKKTYWCPVKEEVVSTLVLPRNLVVNYWTKCLADSERISELIPMTERVVRERMASGAFIETELGEPPTPEQPEMAYNRGEATPPNDSTTPYTIIEQHCWLDIDDKEILPYIVTFHWETGKVLRIVARYDENTLFFNEEGDLIKATPIEYYTKFGFVPNPDGSFYDLGFGTLLGPLNEAVNTIINQLVDSGTLANMQAGFIGKGLRLKLGESRFTPGEWKSVNATGQDLKNQIMPLPTKEPSSVLFQLMGSLITSGKELASVAEIFTGKMPGQNTPATTTMASVEQGMKVFTAIYKRIYRSLNEEFAKIYDLNGTYMNPQTYMAILDDEIGPNDFEANGKTYDICPGADPTANSQQEKMMKAQALLELLPTGILDPIVVVKRLLEAQEQPNPDELLNKAIQQTGEMPPPPPDPKLMEMEMKGKMEQQKMQMQAEQMQRKGELEARDKAVQLAMKQREHMLDLKNKQDMAAVQRQEAIHKQRIFSAEAQQKMNVSSVQGAQSIRQREEGHLQKLRQTKQSEAAKPKPKGNSK